MIPLPTRRATIHLAEGLAPLLDPGDLVVLEGDLGAGKTFFTRALCRAFDVPPSIPITSPTFTLVHEIDGRTGRHPRLAIRHADLYRLRDADELAPLGLREQRREGAILVVEWGTPYIEELGGDALVLSLAVSAAGERTASMRGTGPRGDALARACAAP